MKIQRFDRKIPELDRNSGIFHEWSSFNLFLIVLHLRIIATLRAENRRNQQLQDMKTHYKRFWSSGTIIFRDIQEKQGVQYFYMPCNSGFFLIRPSWTATT